MTFHIITIFPHIFDSYFNESILKRALKNNLINIKIHNLRDWTTDKHKTVDDAPFGGGAGMVMKIEPLYKALKALNFQFTIYNLQKNTKFPEATFGTSKIQNTKYKYHSFSLLLFPAGGLLGLPVPVPLRPYLENSHHGQGAVFLRQDFARDFAKTFYPAQ